MALVDAAEGPSLSQWLEEHGNRDHLDEFVVHRAAYQLQEADPHSFAIPRLAASECKTALLQLQLDEYGGHEPTEAHSVLFAETMEALGLEADLDLLPWETLATNTLLNWLGRSRRLVPACLGHLAVFEMTSVEPMARYAAAIRRLVPGPEATTAARFFDVHVAADGLHGTIATDRLIAGFVADHPDEAHEVLFGAAALLHVERRFAEHLLAAWRQRGDVAEGSPRRQLAHLSTPARRRQLRARLPDVTRAARRTGQGRRQVGLLPDLLADGRTSSGMSSSAHGCSATVNEPR